MTQLDKQEIWEGWDDPLADVARFLQAATPHAVAEQLYHLVLREQTVDRMVAEGLDPQDPQAARSFFAEHIAELNTAAHNRLLEICSAIASQEG
ncbi:MAG: hypothetical protein OEM52_08255 [bacterium]|nr:hypothetical protein [bacterium]